MPNDLENYLASTPTHATISPEVLEMMGKQAANMFLDSGLSLNEAVVKLASEHNDINHEQLKRVAEYANTATYLARHDQSKTAGDNSSYPQFELADPARIIQDMSDGARPTVVTPTDLDYGKQPEKKEKVSSAYSEELLADMFDTKGATLREELGFTKEAAFNEVMETKDTLISLRSHLRSVGEQYDMMNKEASEEFYQMSKNHLLDDGSFADVLAAARSSGAPAVKIGSALKPHIERLLKEKVSTIKQLRAQNDLSKVAHRMVDETHPMVSSFRAILATDAEIEKVAAGLEEVETQLKEVNAFIKETLRASASR